MLSGASHVPFDRVEEVIKLEDKEVELVGRPKLTMCIATIGGMVNKVALSIKLEVYIQTGTTVTLSAGAYFMRSTCVPPTLLPRLFGRKVRRQRFATCNRCLLFGILLALVVAALTAHDCLVLSRGSCC